MLIIKAILISTLFKTIFGHRLTLFKNIYTETDLVSSKCIKSVLRKEIPCGTLINIISSRQDIDSFLSNLGKDDCYSVIVRRFKNQNWLVPTKVYVFIAKNAQQFSKGMKLHINDIFWDPKALNIIEILQLDNKDIEIIFDVMLRFNIFRVILVRRISKDNVILYTYYPFKGTNCGLKYEYASIGNCDDVNKTKSFLNKRLNLRNCNITVVANKDAPNFIYEEGFKENGSSKLPGLEQFLLETIAEKEGIHVQYKLVPKELSFGVVLPNNTATGLLNFLQRDEVDIAAGGIVLIKNRINMFDYIWGYNYAALNLFTPVAGEEIWKDVYKEFSLNTWMLIALAYCTVTFISIIVQRWKSRTPYNHVYLSLLLWGYLYTNTCKPLTKDIQMRRLMVFWIWFTFFIGNFYNTALYSLLTGREQIKRLITVDDLNKLPFEPCISESTRTYFLFAMNKTLPTGLDIPECQYTDTALEYISSGNAAYAIEMEYVYKLTEHRYVDDEGNPKIEAWTFSMNNVLVMYLTRGFPMTKEFQDYAWKLHESGILKHHMNRLYEDNNPKMRSTAHRAHFKKILLADLRIHFLILTVGSMLSVLCFIIEMITIRK